MSYPARAEGLVNSTNRYSFMSNPVGFCEILTLQQRVQSVYSKLLQQDGTIWFFSQKSDSKSLHICRIFLSILADFTCALGWIVSILPLISTSPSLFSRFLGTVIRTPTMIDITITFHNLFQFSSKALVFVEFFSLFYYHTMVNCNGKRWQVFSSCQLKLSSVFCPGLVFQSPR